MNKLTACLIGLSLLPALALAEDFNAKRAKSNYQIFCQGCHSPTGSGYRGVPEINGFIGNFLSTQKGREYLVQVPGSANAVLDNDHLAEVLNWMILEFSGPSLPKKWTTYTGEEVGKLRKTPLMEVVEYRKSLLESLPSQ